MPQPICPYTTVLAVGLATMLVGCTTKPAAVSADPSADEAAVRQTLARVEQRFNQGDIGFVDVFAKDAVIIAPSTPDIVGFDAIRAMYAGLMEKMTMNLHFSTREVVLAGDLAFERGTYTLKMSDKASGKVLQDVKNNHMHILKRQPDGSWNTWRMMTSRSGHFCGGWESCMNTQIYHETSFGLHLRTSYPTRREANLTEMIDTDRHRVTRLRSNLLVKICWYQVP